VASLARSLVLSVVILTLLTTLVGGFCGSLVAPHTHASFDISLVIPALSHLLVLRVRLIALLTPSRVAIRPAAEAIHADAVLLAKRSHQSARICGGCAHRSYGGTRILTFRSCACPTPPLTRPQHALLAYPDATSHQRAHRAAARRDYENL
jgi:hypothetical protein